MSKIDNGGPAFPLAGSDDGLYSREPGMTLRDYFAAKAMHAYLTHHQGVLSPEHEIAGAAYEYADAMLAARES